MSMDKSKRRRTDNSVPGWIDRLLLEGGLHYIQPGTTGSSSQHVRADAQNKWNIREGKDLLQPSKPYFGFRDWNANIWRERWEFSCELSWQLCTVSTRSSSTDRSGATEIQNVDAVLSRDLSIPFVYVVPLYYYMQMGMFTNKNGDLLDRKSFIMDRADAYRLVPLSPCIEPGKFRYFDEKCHGNIFKGDLLPVVSEMFELVSRNQNKDNQNNSSFDFTDISEQVLSFLIVEKVNMSEVSVIGCSSFLRPSEGQVYTFRPEASLIDNENDCWMSGDASFHKGLGEEWIEYALSSDCTFRRITFVSIRIPKLPAGPNAVKTFHLEVPVTDSTKSDGTSSSTFIRASHDFVLPTDTMADNPTIQIGDDDEIMVDRSAMRNIQVPFLVTPQVEASRVRVVFTESHTTRNDCTGLWSVVFQ